MGSWLVTFRGGLSDDARGGLSAAGTATLPLTSGVWLIKTVHLVPGKNVQWESLWASLTFER